MATNYERGRAFEYRIKSLLEEDGWYCWRTPASKSPVDIIAVKNGKFIVVQAKAKSLVANRDKLQLKEFCELVKCKGFIAYKDRDRKLKVEEIK